MAQRPRPMPMQVDDTDAAGSVSGRQRSATNIIPLDNFEKINTRSARQTLNENEAAWIENLQIVAHNNLVAVPAVKTPPLTTISGTTILRMYGVNILNVDYIIAFGFDGSADKINADTGATTQFAAPGTFTNPDMTGYNSARALIIDPGAAGYCTLESTGVFVKSGGVSPNINVTAGGVYAATPGVTITGGSGAGATAHAVMGGSGASQFVAQVILDTPGSGYKAGDVLVVNFSAGAAAASARIWPQQVGTSIAVFAGRVWTANGRILSFTGTQGFDDTNPSNAAGSTTVTDSDLAHVITSLRNLNNYLYIVGDQSIRQIGNITVSSSITLFTPLTLSSDIGTSFQNTILSYNRLMLFANKQGVYGVFGASVQKISDDLDGIFQATDFTQTPTAALNDLRNIHCYLLLLKYLDPVQGSRSIIVVFQEKRWYVVSQGGGLVSICSLPLASTTQIATFGSAGGVVSQLLADTNTAVACKLVTALTHHGNLIQAKMTVRAGCAVTTQNPATITLAMESENSSNQYTLSASAPLNFVNNLNQLIQFQNNSFANIQFTSGGFKFPMTDVEAYGKFLGVTFTVTAANFSLNIIAIEYQARDMWGITP